MIIIRLDVILAKNKVRSKELAEAIGITEQNLSLLKNGKVKGIRLDTLEKICAFLDCQPGDILEYVAVRLLRHLGGRTGLSFPEALGITGGDDPKSEDDDQNPQQVWLALHRLPPPSRQFSRPVLAIILSPEHPAPLKNGIFR